MSISSLNVGDSGCVRQALSGSHVGSFALGQGTKISSLSLCCNMVLSITGSAVLGVGAQMKTLGWVIAPVLLFAGAGLTSELVWLMSVTMEHVEAERGVDVFSYQDFAEGALGRPGWWASAVSSTLSLVGMIIGGLILESDNLQIVAPIRWAWPLGGDPSTSGRKWWALLVSSTTVLYCAVDIGSLLHKAGLVGVVLTVLCMALVYGGTFSQLGSVSDFNEACRDGTDMPYHSWSINTDGGTGFQAFLSFFSVTSYMVFIFAVVVTLPTMRSTMQRKEKLTAMSTIAFFIVAAEFLIIMLVQYWVFGNLGPQNVLEGMRVDRDAHPGWWATTDPWSVGRPTWVGKSLGFFMTLHLLCSDAIYVPVTVVAVEALLPRHLAGRKSVWFTLRAAIVLVRFGVATTIKDFVKMTNLTSAAFVTMNNMLLPVMGFYYAGPRERAGWCRRVVHGLVFVFGLCSMIFGSISAVQDLVKSASAAQPGQFPREGISPQCHEAYCLLHAGARGCSAAAGVPTAVQLGL